MKIMKSFVLAIVLITTLNGLAQNTVSENNLVKDANEVSGIITSMVNLNDSIYAGITFDSIINSYKGKVIYLDFWASWCRPCKNEMPYSLKMQQYFKGKDIVFLYLSSDRNPKAWETAIDQLKLTGENYLVNGRVHNEYNQLFNVKYIPRYVLINKDGNVVEENAKRPSSSEIIIDIEKLL